MKYSISLCGAVQVYMVQCGFHFVVVILSLYRHGCYSMTLLQCFTRNFCVPVLVWVGQVCSSLCPSCWRGCVTRVWSTCSRQSKCCVHNALPWCRQRSGTIPVSQLYVSGLAFNNNECISRASLFNNNNNNNECISRASFHVKHAQLR